MSALDSLVFITNNPNLMNYGFKYCLVDETKHPFTVNEDFARPNRVEDFVDIHIIIDLDIHTLERYSGLGVSVQASNVCAIDVDHCFKNRFDLDSIDERGKNIIKMFESIAYIEFSFSGTGLRIFFKSNPVKDYEKKYYTKNSNVNIEFYYPKGSFRYVTITGKTICNNPIKELDEYGKYKLDVFLDTYMARKYELCTNISDEIIHDNNSIEHLMKLVKVRYLTNNNFQDLWFSKAPGSGKDESERDYHLVAYLYENITKDKDKIKQIFEISPFYQSKDYHHMYKWKQNDFRYYNYLYDKIHAKEEGQK